MVSGRMHGAERTHNCEDDKSQDKLNEASARKLTKRLGLRLTLGR